MFLTIISFLAVLSILVFAHELGHFWVARKCGVKAEEFGLGFPPRFFGVYKDKDGKKKYIFGGKKVEEIPGTIYSLNYIPIGGFVKIKGENGDEEKARDSFINHPIWQRILILSAGVTMNIVLAAVLFSFGFMFGLPQTVDGLDKNAKISDVQVQILQVLPESPADRAGLRVSDVVFSVNGENIINEEQLQEITNNNTGNEVNYTIKRGKENIDFKIIPEIIEETEKGGIGISIASVGLAKYPWYLAIWEGIKTTIFLTWAILVAFYGMIKGLIMGQGAGAELAGPIGIASLTGQFARMGIGYLLQFAALLSINLAILNFFPFPALDGGRVLFLIIEKIKGSPVKREVEAVIHNTGFIILMVLVLVVTFLDVAKFGDSFRALWDKIF